MTLPAHTIVGRVKGDKVGGTGETRVGVGTDSVGRR